MKIDIVKYRAVAAWTWDVEDDTCGICRNPFDGCCPKCKVPGDDCPLLKGACAHVFHQHCIEYWLTKPQSSKSCPMCRTKWRLPGEPEPEDSEEPDDGENALRGMLEEEEGLSDDMST